MASRRVLATVICVVAGFVALGHSSQAQAVAPSCGAFTRQVEDRVNPESQAQLLTDDAQEATSYAANGFTTSRGKNMAVAEDSDSGLLPVHRLYRPSTRDLFYTARAQERARAVAVYGYQDEGVSFYASTTAESCLIPVFSFLRHRIHRFTVLPGERSILQDSGWKPEGVRFYVGPPPDDDAFSLAVMPDTQQETLSGTDGRFINRSNWLIGSRTSLDLRYVTLTGDLVNWDSADHVQYRRAAAALAPLKTAGIPYSISPGNHDTDAVCEAHGGSACDPPRTHIRVRQTPSLNRFLADGTEDLAGRFEAGKVDNTYSTFAAGNAKWLVLNLELWPRAAAVDWAESVVRSHPDDNVIVVTHSYLTANGQIYDRREYGDESPTYLFDHLIRVYPNIRLVLSGHVGTQAVRTDVGQNGNKIVSLLLTMHSNVTNPMRLIEVNTAADSLDTWVYAPYTRTRYPTYSSHFTSMQWIR